MGGFCVRKKELPPPSGGLQQLVLVVAVVAVIAIVVVAIAAVAVAAVIVPVAAVAVAAVAHSFTPFVYLKALRLPCP